MGQVDHVQGPNTSSLSHHLVSLVHVSGGCISVFKGHHLDLKAIAIDGAS